MMRIPEVESMIKTLMEGDNVSAYAAVVIRRAVLRRRSHFIIVYGGWVNRHRRRFLRMDNIIIKSRESN